MRSKAAERLNQILTEHPELIPFMWEAMLKIREIPDATEADFDRIFSELRPKYGY